MTRRDIYQRLFTIFQTDTKFDTFAVICFDASGRDGEWHIGLRRA